jgi:hypothetical protein
MCCILVGDKNRDLKITEGLGAEQKKAQRFFAFLSNKLGFILWGF